MSSDMHRLSADLGPVRPLTDAETAAARRLIADGKTEADRMLAQHAHPGHTPRSSP